MRDWRIALEAGINLAWGGRKTAGYSSTVNLVALVASILDKAGFDVVPRNAHIDGRDDGEDIPNMDPDNLPSGKAFGFDQGAQTDGGGGDGGE